MPVVLIALGPPSGWARLIPDATLPVIWCTVWDSEGYGFLLLLVAIRLAVGLLPRPAAASGARPGWPRFFVTVIGALTARGVASRVLATPRHGGDAQDDLDQPVASDERERTGRSDVNIGSPRQTPAVARPEAPAAPPFTASGVTRPA